MTWNVGECWEMCIPRNFYLKFYWEGIEELTSSIRENGFNKGFTFVSQFFLCSMSLGRESDLSTSLVGILTPFIVDKNANFGVVIKASGI